MATSFVRWRLVSPSGRRPGAEQRDKSFRSPFTLQLRWRIIILMLSVARAYASAMAVNSPIVCHFSHE